MTVTTTLQPPKTLAPNQQAILLLWKRINTSLSAYYKLTRAFHSAQAALSASDDEWAMLKIHTKHIERHKQASDEADQAFLASIESQIKAGFYQLLFSNDVAYPEGLKQLFDPPPLLFYRGNASRLQQAQIAMVGSRKPSQNAQKNTYDMAQYLAQAGFVITSGLAQGVDAQAHLGALAQSADGMGRTVGVMGTGIDVCYPKQHLALFDRIVNEGGCIISELLPGTQPNKHTFPRRNRIVAGLSLGAIVTEAAVKSGSLITARLASEQGKQVFAIPSNIDNINAEGCHHLIREGATLIYHPDQVINDLSSQLITPNIPHSSSYPSSENPDGYHQQKEQQYSNKPINPPENHSTASKTANKSRQQQTKPAVIIADHLQQLWVHIGWEGQDLDALVQKTGMATAPLLSQLMELELTGAITQAGGRYKRLSS